MKLPDSPISTVVNENSYDALQYSPSVRLLRATTSWGIHASVYLLGIIAFPVVLICFLAGGLLLLPILAFLQGCRFIISFFGFEFKFPRLWSNLFGKKKLEQKTE